MEALNSLFYSIMAYLLLTRDKAINIESMVIQQADIDTGLYCHPSTFIFYKNRCCVIQWSFFHALQNAKLIFAAMPARYLKN